MGRPCRSGGKGSRPARPGGGRRAVAGNRRRPKGKGKGGGKGKRKGPPRRGFARGPSLPAATGDQGRRGPPPLPSDATSPFLHPTPRPLVAVPLEFQSLAHWCHIIGNNILAEFWHVFQEGRPSFSGFGVAAGDELLVEDAPGEGLAQCLLLLDGQPRLVASQRIIAPGKIALKLRGGDVRSGHFRSLGYVGSFMAEFSAILELRTLSQQAMTPPMLAILEPKVDLPGSYVKRPINASAVPVNVSQRATIEGLAFALEKIQGPPGTGKSTTIYHLLDARIPHGNRVLVTCSRNVAVESIAQKLSGLDDWPLCVFGPRDRVGSTARQYLLADQVGRHFESAGIAAVSKLAGEKSSEISAAIHARETSLRGRRYEHFLRGFLRRRYAHVYSLQSFCDRVISYCSTLAGSPAWCQSRAQDGRSRVLTAARVLLCTIASTSRMLREWEESTGSELTVHTVIVDESGCTPESSTALLLRLRPQNLILVGDHKQLPPVSQVPPQILEGTGHTRSLLERCVLASGRVHQLREQYRMHPAIANVVSNLFYAGRLQTPPEVASARVARERQAMLWMDVNGREDAPERSYLNAAEVSAAVRTCAHLREVAPEATIAVLTFYRGQLGALMREVPSSLDVEVLTVDACQGSEFDYVVLSTVRCNAQQRLGFLRDQQRINVAISRARYKLILIGSRATLAIDGDWLQVQKACQTVSSKDLTPQKALPTTFTSVFEALQEQKRLEAEKRAASAEQERAQSGDRQKPVRGAGSSRSSALAESLMRQQPSMSHRRRGIGASYGSGPLQRRTDGSYQSRSIAVAIGGGFRRRADVMEMEAIAAQHMASLGNVKESDSRNWQSGSYAQPKSATELERQFPSLDEAGQEPAAPAKSRLPRAQNLRPATGNDEKRRWRTQRRQAERSSLEAAAGSADLEIELLQESQGAADLVAGASGTDLAAPEADVDEAFLFSMFPDEREEVEQTLLRFAGASHQAARAFEVLLARSSGQEKKNTTEAEDELDYDCADSGGSEDGDDAEGMGTLAEGEDEDDYQDENAEDGDIWQCAGCGEVTETTEAEDGFSYCAWCWAEWMASSPWEASPASAADKSSKADASTSTSSSKQPATTSQPASSNKPAERPKKKEDRDLFASLGGVSQWAAIPERPEAGGKELVELKNKKDRDIGGAVSKAKRSAEPILPAAAAASPKQGLDAVSFPARCRELLAEVRPPVDEAVVEYLASMMEDDLSEDTKEVFVETLEGYDISRDVAGAVWDAVLAGA